MPLRARRSGPKYQVSTERETLTTSEDDSSAAINATPYIRITEPQSGRKSLVESLAKTLCRASKKPARGPYLENEIGFLIQILFLQEENLEERQTKGSFPPPTTKPLLRLRQKSLKRRKAKRKKRRRTRIHPLPLSSGFYSKSKFTKFCVVEREIWSEKWLHLFSLKLFCRHCSQLHWTDSTIVFLSSNKFSGFLPAFNVIQVDERELSLV